PLPNGRTSMTSAWKKRAGAVALAAGALAGATVAFGAGTAKQAATATTTTGSTTTSRSGHVPETELTGDVLAKVKAAAVAKAGGTADRATTETDNSNAVAVYEVHVTKADGSHVVVILDKDYAVLTVETQATGLATHGVRRR